MSKRTPHAQVFLAVDQGNFNVPIVDPVPRNKVFNFHLHCPSITAVDQGNFNVPIVDTVPRNKVFNFHLHRPSITEHIRLVPEIPRSPNANPIVISHSESHAFIQPEVLL